MTTPFHVLIIGAGTSGLASAILLHRTLTARSVPFQISVFELRSGPATLGGAVNVTPNAVKLLDHLGVLKPLEIAGCTVKTIEIISSRSLKPLGGITFGDVDRYGANSLRIARKDLQVALLSEVEKCGIRVSFSEKLESVEQTQDYVQAIFADGTRVTGNILIGCDGTHSAVRGCIDPDRKPVYTGLSNTYSYVNPKDPSVLPIKDTSAIFQCRVGSLLLTWSTPSRTERLFWAAVMEIAAPEDLSKDGWRSMGDDVAKMKNRVKETYCSEKDPQMGFFADLLEATEDDIFFYPVWKLDMSEKWWEGRCVLLGDAAHAMPPLAQGVGLALDDAVMLDRLVQGEMDKRKDSDTGTIDTKDIVWDNVWKKLVEIRISRVRKDYDRAVGGFEGLKDKGWFAAMLKDWIVWLYLWIIGVKFDEAFKYDVLKEPLV
ncbi:6-hydroxynicotinate 3-monooxygenase [Drechslerella dactyloides]|uniref:6-hydroxynicotinate 3-monooxygenase n=1 Tax=Drechslerella dactyloides TaxID=74499 RepID=A0AAD6J6A3_DREDA|nr:6-hydroxynicotinate 3-monooxygenase [Drechslerella dactyloides]